MATQSTSPASVLIADDDPEVGRQVSAFLADRGYDVEWADAGEKAYNCLDTRTFDVLVTETRIGRHDGIRLMNVARERKPDLCTIVVTEPSDVARATDAMREGAFDFQTKPLNMEKLEAVIERGLGYQQLLYEQQQLKRRLDEQYGLTSLIGQSRVMTLVYDTLRQCASALAPMILSGEPGTGKDLVAQAIHNSSVRRNEPFVKLDCRAGTPATLERELFGAPASGSEKANPGRAALADGGTLYLDHFEALPEMLAKKVFALLETGRVTRDADKKRVDSSVRLIASIDTSHDAEAAEPRIERLRNEHGAVAIDLPPLRERIEDIPLLLEYFIAEACRRRRIPEPRVGWDALALLQRYPWPGNVRELRECAETMAYAARPGQFLTLTSVPASIRDAAGTGEGDVVIPAGATMKEVERIVIEDTMRACGNDKAECARRLGIGLRTLYRKLSEYENA